MQTLVDHFKPCANFNRFDFEHTDEDRIHLDCFCVIAEGIERDANGSRLKDIILKEEIVKEALEYIQVHAPEIKTLLK